MGTTLDTEVKPGNRKGKPNYTVEFKRRLAVAASEPGVSVSKLALANQVNTNMVFKWRRDLRAGLLDVAPQSSATLLPVVLASTSVQNSANPARVANTATGGALIEIVIADALVRVCGDVDGALLKIVIQSLRQ